jgi:methylated-DNA-[protein]-cysteine S-methyltransferase
MNYQLLDSPIGQLRLVSDKETLVAIEFPGRHRLAATLAGNDPVLLEAAGQLHQYFAGERRRFNLPLAPAGTAFQRSVWTALGAIPYGEVRSYGDIARAIGRASAARAVGAANGRNPLPIVVPCHRVIGGNGRLTGFAGGLQAKQTLLQIEGALPA